MEDEIKVEQISPLSLYEADKAQYDVQIATAKMYPRSIQRSLDNAVMTVTMDTETAETCNYALPRGGKTISGPSVHLAKILMQYWGNMRAEARVVNVDQTTLTSQAVAFDLENNIAIKVEVKRSIVQNEYKNGKPTGRKIRMNEDMQVVTGNAANSIALRNAILSVIPRPIVDKVYNAAKNKITGDLTDEKELKKKRDSLIKAFEQIGVTKEEILKLIGKQMVEQIDQDDLVTLTGLGRAIKDGDTTIEMAFGRTKEPKVDKESERISMFIEKAASLDDLEILKDQLTPETELAWKAKWIKLGGK